MKHYNIQYVNIDKMRKQLNKNNFTLRVFLATLLGNAQ